MALDPRTYLPELFAEVEPVGEPAPARLPGRVLKVKLGHNPNSSGIGAVALVFVWGTLTAGTVIAMTSSFLLARMAREPGPEKDTDAQPPTNP